MEPTTPRTPEPPGERPPYPDIVTFADCPRTKGMPQALADLHWKRFWRLWMRAGWLYEQRRREAEGLTAFAVSYAGLVEEHDASLAAVDEEIARFTADQEAAA